MTVIIEDPIINEMWPVIKGCLSWNRFPLEVFWWACLALVLLGIGACAGPLAQQGTKGRRTVKPQGVGIIHGPGCCSTAEAELQELRRTLGQMSSIKLQELTPQDQPASGPAAADDLVRDSLERASKHYLNMKMEHAQQILEYAVRRLRQEGARKVAPQILAKLHLTLGAVYLAAGQHDAAQRDFQTAVGIDPQLVPDRDIFAPEVRQAVDKARRGLRRSEVKIHTTPPGAAVNWNGEARGETPLILKDLPHGDHFLAMDRPLYQPWQDQVRISADAQLQIKLQPQPPGRLVAELLRHPTLRLEAARLLELDRLLICSPHPEGLAVEVLTPRGGIRQQAVVVSRGHRRADVQKVAALVDQRLIQTSGASRGPAKKKSSSRTPWIIGAVAATVGISLAVILPITLSGSSDSGRPVHFKLP